MNGFWQQLSLDNIRLPRPLHTNGCIAALLPHGVENAMSARDLAHRAGCADARELRRRVAAERAGGALILSLPSVGYFLPADGDRGRVEAALFVRSMSARARNTARATAAARAFLMEGRDE